MNTERDTDENTNSVDFAGLYRELLGREATADELQQLLRVVTALKIQKNDAFVTIMMALQAFTILFREMPGRIYQCTSDVCTGVRETAQDLADSAAARSVEKVATQLAQHVMRTVDRVAVRKSWTELVHACVIAGICLAASSWGGWWARGNYADVATVATAAQMQAVVDAVKSADDLASFAKNGISKQDMSKVAAALKVLDADNIDAAAKMAKNGNVLDMAVNPGKYDLKVEYDKGRKYVQIPFWIEPKK